MNIYKTCQSDNQLTGMSCAGVLFLRLAAELMPFTRFKPLFFHKVIVKISIKAQTNHCALRTSRIYLTANLRPKIGFVGFGTDEHRDGMRYWSPELFDQDIKCVQYSKVYLRTLGLNVKTYKPESLLNSL